MRSWNQLKISVLKVVQRNPDSTSKDIALALAISEDASQVALHRYYRQGLLSRTKRLSGFNKATFCYKVNTRGITRIEHLEKDLRIAT